MSWDSQKQNMEETNSTAHQTQVKYCIHYFQRPKYSLFLSHKTKLKV